MHGMDPLTSVNGLLWSAFGQLGTIINRSHLSVF